MSILLGLLLFPVLEAAEQENRNRPGCFRPGPGKRYGGRGSIVYEYIIDKINRTGRFQPQ